MGREKVTTGLLASLSPDRRLLMRAPGVAAQLPVHFQGAGRRAGGAVQQHPNRLGALPVPRSSRAREAKTSVIVGLPSGTQRQIVE